MAMDVAMARVRATVRVGVTAMAAIGSSYGHVGCCGGVLVVVTGIVIVMVSMWLRLGGR
jgi:hypothetical protein